MIPRDESEKDIRRAEDDFQQKPFELSRPTQPKMEPKGSARTIIGGIKRTLGLEKVPEDDVESRSIGMDSMGVRFLLASSLGRFSRSWELISTFSFSLGTHRSTSRRRSSRRST